ncbi:iron-containing alcohol dehydrogenase, partial [bacterium]|nr:iron-containing alcohol dehydrogenase [bacterium]
IWNITTSNNIEAASQAIERTGEFFKSIGLPSTLTELGVSADSIEIMAKKATVNGGVVGRLKKLSSENVVEILRNAL